MTSNVAARAEEVLPGVFRLDCPFGQGGMVYVYYLDTPEPAIVDTGVKASPPEVIEPGLRAAGKSLGGVRHLFNTHGHWDHMGGNQALRRLAPRARTYLAAEDRHLLESAARHYQGYSSYAARLLEDRDELRQIEQMQGSSIECPTPVDVLVEDGQVIELGGGQRVRVVRTAGHSDGSTSYLLEGAGALFTGDGIQGLGSRPGQLPLIFDDSNAYRGSIAKVAALSVQALCMGHAFCGVSPAAGRDPVRQGTAARQFLVDSGEAAKAVEEAARSVIARHDNGTPDFHRFSLALFDRLTGPLGVELDEHGMSPRSMATAHAYFRELTGAPKPA